MGLLLKMGDGVKGSKLISTNIELLSCMVSKELPIKSVAPSSEEMYTITLEGKISKNDQGVEPTISTIAEWSSMPSGSVLALRNIEVTENTGDYTNRVYSMPLAFVFAYKETFEASEGEGRFVLVMRQKKEQNTFFGIAGGFNQTQEDAGFLGTTTAM
ncbi:MAG: hypothetical protein KFW09_04560 [Oscillospiraceae bacterium]|nr:hypothetical protein [Oscillospiraceae bacterium]